jgi:signal transduction histidine kinase
VVIGIIGFTRSLVAGIVVGHPNGYLPLTISGAYLSATIWAAIPGRERLQALLLIDAAMAGFAVVLVGTVPFLLFVVTAYVILAVMLLEEQVFRRLALAGVIFLASAAMSPGSVASSDQQQLIELLLTAHLALLMLVQVSVLMRELRRTSQHGAELIDQQRRLVAGVSHELRTPLTAIIGYLEIITDDVDSLTQSDLDSIHRTISTQAADLSAIVEDLLIVARDGIDTITVSAEVHAIDELVSEVAGGFSHQRTQPDSSVRVIGDEVRIRQILRNLLSNAERYGGASLELTVEEIDGVVHTRVSDDGPGIPVSQREVIFGAFERADAMGAHPSSIGLGLNVSRTLANLMGGQLEYSYVDGWSVFDLALPSARSEQHAIGTGM